MVFLSQDINVTFDGWFQEKALVMGWDPATLSPEPLSCRQLGQALGNAWPLPVSARLVCQLNNVMKWQ